MIGGPRKGQVRECWGTRGVLTAGGDVLRRPLVPCTYVLYRAAIGDRRWCPGGGRDRRRAGGQSGLGRAAGWRRAPAGVSGPSREGRPVLAQCVCRCRGRPRSGLASHVTRSCLPVRRGADLPEPLLGASSTTAPEAKILDVYDADFGYDADTFLPRQPVHWLWTRGLGPQSAVVPRAGKAGRTCRSWCPGPEKEPLMGSTPYAFT